MSAGGRAGRTAAATDGEAAAAAAAMLVLTVRVPMIRRQGRRRRRRRQKHNKRRSLQQVHAAVYDCERGRFNSINWQHIPTALFSKIVGNRGKIDRQTGCRVEHGTRTGCVIMQACQCARAWHGGESLQGQSMPLRLGENSSLNAWDGRGLSKPVNLSIPLFCTSSKFPEYRDLIGG